MSEELVPKNCPVTEIFWPPAVFCQAQAISEWQIVNEVYWNIVVRSGVRRVLDR